MGFQLVACVYLTASKMSAAKKGIRGEGDIEANTFPAYLQLGAE